MSSTRLTRVWPWGPCAPDGRRAAPRRTGGAAGRLWVVLAVPGFAGCVAQAPSDEPIADADGPMCPSDLPESCPSPPPSYDRDIAPIVEARCYPCHETEGKAGAKHDFSTYEGIYAQRVDTLSAVYGCVMPPTDAGVLFPDERATLLGWLVCHAPNN